MSKLPLSIALSALLLTSGLYAENNVSHGDISINVTTTNQSLQSINDTTSDISVLSETDLEESGDMSVAEAISHVAGITLSSNGGLGQPESIFMRGQSAGGVLILLDGMRLNDPSTTDGRAMIENIMIDSIKQIEVIKGGSSSIWGGNASAGVINIITKNSYKSGFHGRLQLNGGSHSTKGANALISYGGDRLTAQIITSYLDSDSFSALAPRDGESDEYTNKMVNLKVGYTLSDSSALDFAYYAIDAKGDYDDAYSALLADDAYSHYKSLQENYSLKYTLDLGMVNSVIKASKGSFDRDYFTNSFGEAKNEYRSTIKELSLINSHIHQYGKITLGLESKNIDGLNNYISDYPSNPSQSTYKNRAAFLSNLYNIDADTLLETNLRYDYFDEFDNEVTYKIGLKRNFKSLEGATARANYYTAYNSPSAYQLANTALGELLEPSYSRGFDISANYKELLKITYFNTKVDNPIEYDMDSFGYYNVGGKEKFSGVEVSTKYRLPNLNLLLGANLTHLITYESYDTTKLSNRAKETLNVSADYYIGDMHFGMTGQYIGDRVDLSSEDTGNYTLCNLNFDTKIAKDFKLYINAKNIFDTDYESVYGYATEGRSIYAKVEYKF